MLKTLIICLSPYTNYVYGISIFTATLLKFFISKNIIKYNKI